MSTIKDESFPQLLYSDSISLSRSFINKTTIDQDEGADITDITSNSELAFNFENDDINNNNHENEINNNNNIVDNNNSNNIGNIDNNVESLQLLQLLLPTSDINSNSNYYSNDNNTNTNNNSNNANTEAIKKSSSSSSSFDTIYSVSGYTAIPHLSSFNNTADHQIQTMVCVY